MTLSCSQAKLWVKTHYEINDDGVVAKSVMYKHYEEHCLEQQRTVMETSIFGRVVKSVFPDVTIRRLGGRDNLKYYYCGIRAKDTSPHAIDNTTTTRPKRRLRKRELVTNKTEVDHCLRWLHAHFVAATESSVVKTDVYERYVSYCKQRGVSDPLSIQYFGMVVTHAFPNVTKRKLGPRTNQQKYYFGIQERSCPMSPDAVPKEFINMDVLTANKLSTSPNDGEEEDFSCRSPASDISDLGARASYEEAKPRFEQYHNYGEFYANEDPEPIDYSLGSEKIKTECSEDIQMKYQMDSNASRTPERPSSVMNFSGGDSPSNGSSKPKKIYKPRFHFDYKEPSSWNSDRDSGSYFMGEKNKVADEALRSWLATSLEHNAISHVNRDQLYECYEKYCYDIGCETLPMTHFDETMLKQFPGTVTNIHNSRKTFYQGVRVSSLSPLRREVEEHIIPDEENSWVSNVIPPSVEMYSPQESPSHSSPLPEEEDFPDAAYQAMESMSLTTEVQMQDGKFFLRKWLTDHFETVPDSCVLKSEAYKHYEAYAKSIDQTPFEMNVFGKIVWQVFPDVSVRRLGGRSKPQYHYCGITVKKSSPLFLVMSGKDPAQRSRKKEIATDNRSAELVIEWLKTNYETGEEKITTKSEVFNNYNSHCAATNETPVTLNYFGKLVKHCFPNVEVRKCGGRSDPTWYYYGLGPAQQQFRMTSLYDRHTKENVPQLMEVQLTTPMETDVVMDNRKATYPATSLQLVTEPIPISTRSQGFLKAPASHSYGSPSRFHEYNSAITQCNLQYASPQECSYTRNRNDRFFRRNSPATETPLDILYPGREIQRGLTISPNCDSPSESFSRSPAEIDGSHGHFVLKSVGIHPKESYGSRISYGGQVVPQTPPGPTIIMEHQAINMKRPKFR